QRQCERRDLDDGERRDDEAVHREPADQAVEPHGHANLSPGKSGDHSTRPSSRILANRTPHPASTAGATSKNIAVAAPSAVIASSARVHVAITADVGRPVTASSTWCSPSPHVRRLGALAANAPASSSATPIATLGSSGCSSAI